MQTTIAQRVGYDSVGLDSGGLVHLSLLPAPVDTGVVFVCCDLAVEAGGKSLAGGGAS